MKTFLVVDAIEIAPSFLLQSFVRCFTYREWDSHDLKICRPLFATHEFSITFNLTEKKFGYIRPEADPLIYPEEVMKSEMVITGIGSQFGGFMTDKGKARVFSIIFRSTGFYRVFNIPPVLFTNVIEEEEYACNKSLAILHLQLRESKSISQMTACCENYLLTQLANSGAKDPYNSILSVSDCIVSNSNNTIEKLAYDANMSLKTFERKFIEKVGTSPKLFSSIVRFNKAITLKMSDYRKSWTTIAHDCGYFDQMHFIKDFRRFSGNLPGAFFKHTPPVTENFIDSPVE